MRRRKSAMPDLTRRGLLAHTAGQRLAQEHPGWLQAFREDPALLWSLLNPAEKAAWSHLLPATWWAAFQRGWALGVAQLDPDPA